MPGHQKEILQATAPEISSGSSSIDGKTKKQLNVWRSLANPTGHPSACIPSRLTLMPFAWAFHSTQGLQRRCSTIQTSTSTDTFSSPQLAHLKCLVTRRRSRLLGVLLRHLQATAPDINGLRIQFNCSCCSMLVSKSSVEQVSSRV